MRVRGRWRLARYACGWVGFVRRLVCSAAGYGSRYAPRFAHGGTGPDRSLLGLSWIASLRSLRFVGTTAMLRVFDPPVLKGCGDRKGLKTAKANIDVHVAVKVVHIVTW